MAISLKQIIGRAEQLAIGRGADSSASPVIDSGMTTEQLFMPAVNFCFARRIRENSENLGDFMESYTIAITEGAGDLPAGIVRSLIPRALVSDKPLATYLPYADFLRRSMTQIFTYFSVIEDSFLYSEPKTNFNDPEFSGDVGVRFIKYPTKPVSAIADTGFTEQFANEVALVIASALTGEIPLTELLTTAIE